MFKYSRNINYLGEIFLYGAFIILVNDFYSYVSVLSVWSFAFTGRMYLKDMSLRRKDGWTEYGARSWILLPKINGRFIDSLIFYTAAIYTGVWMYSNGGIKQSFEIIRSAIVAQQ